MGVDHPGLGMSVGELVRTIRRIARQTIQNASIGRAGIRFYDAGSATFVGGGGVRILGGGFIDGSGTFDWTGPMNLQGAQTITGPTTFTGQMTVNGPWKFVGNGQITGDVDVTGTIKVLPGGKIQVGGMTIDPFTGGGRIDFGDGRMIHAASGHLAIYDGTRFIVFNSTGVAINGGGGPTVTVGPGGIQGVPTIPKSQAPPEAFVGAAVFDSNGALRRVVA
jgi:hypothetical protein